MSEHDGDMGYKSESHLPARQARFVNHMKRNPDKHPRNDGMICYNGEEHNDGYAADDGSTLDSHNVVFDSEVLIGRDEGGILGESGQRSKRSTPLREDEKESNQHNLFVHYNQLESEKGKGKK